MRRPWLFIAVTVVGCSPSPRRSSARRWGSVDYRVLPADAPAHVAADKLTGLRPGALDRQRCCSRVPPRRTPRLRRGDRRGRRRHRRAAGGRPTVRHPAAGHLGGQQPDRGAARRSCETSARSRRTRGEALVGGLSRPHRRPDRLGRRHLPWMGLIVAGVMLVLLFLAFGSLVLPFKAVVMNLFSISASFGIVTWIFARRAPLGPARLHAAGVPRRDQPDPDAGDPVRALHGLRGLPALPDPRAVGPHRRQRPRGRHRRPEDRPDHHQCRPAARGRDRGVRTSGIVFMKMLGIGMLVALLIDATVVRALLVPATMKLLGRGTGGRPARWPLVGAPRLPRGRGGRPGLGGQRQRGPGACRSLSSPPRRTIRVHEADTPHERSRCAGHAPSVAGCGGDDGDGDDPADSAFAEQSADKIADAAKADMRELERSMYSGESTPPAPHLDRPSGQHGRQLHRHHRPRWRRRRSARPGRRRLVQGRRGVLAGPGPRPGGRDHRGRRRQVGARHRRQLRSVLRPRRFFENIFTDDGGSYSEYKTVGTDEVDGEDTVRSRSRRPGRPPATSPSTGKHYLLKLESNEATTRASLEFTEFNEEST